jgi:hypothetical protein
MGSRPADIVASCAYEIVVTPANAATVAAAKLAVAEKHIGGSPDPDLRDLHKPGGRLRGADPPEVLDGNQISACDAFLMAVNVRGQSAA